MKRDDVIKQVAQTVGPNHSVDLKNYDCLILVDIYRNILGMSVVSGDFEELKRFNLAEIYDPTPRPQKVRNGFAGDQGPGKSAAETAAATTEDDVPDDGKPTAEALTKKSEKIEALASDAQQPDASTQDATNIKPPALSE